jgi:hypothetical protein
MATLIDNSKNASSKEPDAVSTTTPPRDTYHETTISNGDGSLLYWPEKNAFLAIYPDEYREFHAEADEHSKKIDKLQKANRSVTEAGIQVRAAHKNGVKAEIQKAEATLQQAISDLQHASDDVKKKLQPLDRLDAKDGVKMVEVVSLKKPNQKQKAVPLYIKSTTIERVLADKRIYLLSREKEKRPEEKIFKNGKLDTEEIKRRITTKVQDKAKFSKKWQLKPDDAEDYSGVLSDWARTMNGDIARFLERTAQDIERKFHIDPNDPSKNFNLSGEAQLMRFAGGAGLEMNFNPFKGNLNDKRDGNWIENAKRGLHSGEFGMKANAHASFAIAEGSAHVGLYFPHYAGFHAIAEVGDQVFELGYWRFYGDLVFAGGVGASLAVEIDVDVCYTAGKQGVRGIPAADKNKPGVKARAGASGELDAFAGASASVDAKGTLQWLNPEGSPSNGRPLKIDPIVAVAEFKDIAKVDAGIAGMAGIGVKGAFKIKHEDGKFVVYAKIGTCLGLGGAGSIKFEVDSATIGEFVKCVAYQLKHADYHKIDEAIDARAYKTYCHIHYLVIVAGRNLEEFAMKNEEDLKLEYNAFVEKIDNAIARGAKQADEFVRRLQSELKKQTKSWLMYATPEVLGKIQLQIVAIGLSDNTSMHDQAPELMAMALGATQTMNHLGTVAERMTSQMGDKQDQRVGLQMIESCLAGTLHAGCLAEVERRLANAEPLVSKPFIWNSEPAFVVATLGIEHPMFG